MYMFQSLMTQIKKTVVQSVSYKVLDSYICLLITKIGYTIKKIL